MSKKAGNHGFLPPPHANAEVHKKIMDDLRSMSPQEILQVAIEAGIYTPDGKLTAHYRRKPRTSPARTVQAKHPNGAVSRATKNGAAAKGKKGSQKSAPTKTIHKAAAAAKS